MTLPTGSISVEDINTERNKPINSACNINSESLRELADVPTGLISFDDFRGKSTTKIVAAGNMLVRGSSFFGIVGIRTVQTVGNINQKITAGVGTTISLNQQFGNISMELSLATEEHANLFMSNFSSVLVKLIHSGKVDQAPFYRANYVGSSRKKIVGDLPFYDSFNSGETDVRYEVSYEYNSIF